MEGPAVLAQTLSVPYPVGSQKLKWQYHSRSKRHSITPCWGFLFDLLIATPLLRKHVEERKIIFGLDHQMHSYEAGMDKKLDLIIGTPKSQERSGRDFRDISKREKIELSAQQQKLLAELPMPEEGPVGEVLIALEAKAMFTAFGKSYPRFYDELNSAHRVIHGTSNNAIAIGLAIINCSHKFVSPNSYNKDYPKTGQADFSRHNQPKDALGAIRKVDQLPRRSGDQGPGYEGLGIVLVNCVNDGQSPVTLSQDPKVPDTFDYNQLVTRIAAHYGTRFRQI